MKELLKKTVITTAAVGAAITGVGNSTMAFADELDDAKKSVEESQKEYDVTKSESDLADKEASNATNESEKANTELEDASKEEENASSNVEHYTNEDIRLMLVKMLLMLKQNKRILKRI